MAGLRVLRGEHWSHGNDDGGEGHLGTVTAVNSDLTAKVVWDNGNETNCSIGKNGKYELKIFDNATVGSRHSEVNCDSCSERGIFGMRWHCTTCNQYNLCPLCYFANKHDLNHEFQRFNCQSSQGCPVKKRSTSQRMQATGLFPGATVVRGVDWKSGNQDGGAGKHGKIITIEGSNDSSASRSMVRVKWDSGNTFVYSVGANGKVELKFVDEHPGVYYYKEHLPNMDGSVICQTQLESEKELFKEGDTVFIKLSAKVLQKEQKEHAIWVAGMANCIGKLGVIKSFTPNGDVMVEFDGLRFSLYQGVLQKMPKLSKGDIVTVIDDPEMVQSLQESHGKWDNKMSKVLGKCGTVERVDKDDDVIVAFGNTRWKFNPACCIPTPDKVPDDDDDDDDEDSEDEVNSDSSSDDDADFSEQILVQLAGMVLNAVLEQTIAVSPDELFQHAAKGNASTVGSMLQRAEPGMVNMKHKGLTLLVIAAHEGNKDVVEVLIKNGADIEETDNKKNTPLSAAIIGEQPGVAKLLLDKGASVKTANKQGRTPLHLAAVVGPEMMSIVSILIKKGCLINAQDEDGDTALHDAIEKGNIDVIQVLCSDPKIDLEIFNKKGFMPLQLATLRDRASAVKAILNKSQTTVNKQMKNVEFVALHIAATNDHFECAKLLTGLGKADLNPKGENDATPLHLACKEAYFNIVELLLDKGAEKDPKDKDGNTPLHLAVSGIKQIRTLQSLLGESSGSDNSDRVRIACLLMKRNATYNPKNNDKKTPQEVAKNEDIRRGINFYIEKQKEDLKARPVTPKPGQRRMPGEHEAFPDLPCAGCLRQIADVTLMPCKHKILCKNCCQKVENCPMCCEYIEKRVVGDKTIAHQQCKVQ